MENEKEVIRLIDKRKGMFLVDNVVMNGFGKKLRATGIAFYVVLCRYVNNQTQECYPSITKIQNETGMDRKTIIKCAERCEKLGLIKRETIQGKYTIYTLLEPKNNWWKIITGGKNTTTGGKNTTTGGKSEENELRERTKRTNLERDATRDLILTTQQTQELKTKFPSVNVLEEKEKAQDFLLSTGKRYKNYLAFFRNWLRRCEPALQKPVQVIKKDYTMASSNPLFREWTMAGSKGDFRKYVDQY